MFHAFKGTGVTNNAAPLVNLYFARKTLAGLGFTDGLDNLWEWEAEAFFRIESKTRELEKKDLEKKGMKSGSRRKSKR